MKATPAANNETWTATVNAGEFLICSKVDGCLTGAMMSLWE